MTFTKRLRDGIRRGEITCSVRLGLEEDGGGDVEALAVSENSEQRTVNSGRQ